MRVLLPARVVDKQVGGNTRYVRSVYEGLQASGVSVSFARPRHEARGSALRSIQYACMEGVGWPLSPRDADVIHYPADTGALVKSRVPVVSTVHGLATLHVENVRSRVADALWRQRVRRMISLSDRIITVSESSARDIATFSPGSGKKVVVIPHGIDHGKFNVFAGDSDGVELASAGIEQEYFLYVGNLDPRKNLIELCRAAEIVYKKTGVPLLVGGAPAWDSGPILAVINSTPGVRYLGRVPENLLVPLMRRALAFCFPSTYEGFGFPVIEAMASGAPVICSDRGSLAEVARDSALVLSQIDSASIAAAMLEVAADSSLRLDLRVRGLANALRYQWSHSVSAHAALLREVAR